MFWLVCINHMKLCACYLAVVEGEYAHISSMMYMVSPHDWIGIVLNPDTSQGITTDLIVLVCTL